MSGVGFDGTESQAERTALAWTRTLLATAALAAFLAVTAERSGAPRALVIAMGSLAVIGLLTSSRISRMVWRRAHESLAGTSTAPRPILNLTIAFVVLTMSLTALLISALFWGGPR